MGSKVGTVGYLNARPLTDRIDRDSWPVVADVPSRIAEELSEGRVDVALVPVAAVLADWMDLRVVPGQCIGADGPVESVLLVAETPPEEWTEVLLDGESRTSAVLATLLLRRGPLSDRVAGTVEIRRVEPGTAMADATGSVAALVIGDAAREVPERHGVRLDLAELWKEWTGLPFVFAVWAGRPDLEPELVTHLREAGARGVAEVASKYEGADLTYLTERIRYVLDDRALMGLRRFGALACQEGLLAREDVELFGPTVREVPREAGLLALLEGAVDGSPLSLGEVQRLDQGADLADLAAAADLVRRDQVAEDRVDYRLGVAGDSESEIAKAVSAGVMEVRLGACVTPEQAQAWIGAHPDVRFIAPEGADAESAAGWAAAGVWGWAPEKTGHADALIAWLEVAEVAASQGLAITARLAVGQGEGASGRARALGALRDFHARVGLNSLRIEAAEAPGKPAGSQDNTATDHLRAVALSVLALPNVAVVASPETEGLGMAQASLNVGARDFGVVMCEGDSAGWEAVCAECERLITDAGFRPRRVRGWTPGTVDGGELRC